MTGLSGWAVWLGCLDGSCGWLMVGIMTVGIRSGHVQVFASLLGPLKDVFERDTLRRTLPSLPLFRQLPVRAVDSPMSCSLVEQATLVQSNGSN